MEVVVSAIFKERLLEGCVRQMCAVPSKQVIHPMNDCEGNMRRIHRRFWGQLQKLDYGIGNRLNLRSDIEFRYARHRLQPPRGSSGVAFRNLRAHSNRRIETKPHPFMIPPVMRDLLMRRHRILMAAVCRQVAGNRGLNIHAWFAHAGRISESAGEEQSRRINKTQKTNTRFLEPKVLEAEKGLAFMVLVPNQ